MVIAPPSNKLQNPEDRQHARARVILVFEPALLNDPVINLKIYHLSMDFCTLSLKTKKAPASLGAPFFAFKPVLENMLTNFASL